jgi:hypothetical protein
MKSSNLRIVILVIAILMTKVATAQMTNVQLHREMGTINVNETMKIKREGFRVKFEMLGFDSLGIYYWNTQTLYSTDDKSVQASLQILRGFSFSKNSKLQALFGHQSAIGATSQYYAGLHYPFNLGRVRFLPFFAYVYNKEQQSADFRLTSGISTVLAKKKIQIFGFVNLYTRDKVTPESVDRKEIGFQANPQVWFRFNKQLALGGEVSLDYVGSRYQKLISIPTVAGRWSF